MRKLIYGLLIISLVIGVLTIDSLDLFSKEVNAEDSSSEENLLTVNGQGSIKVKPDIAYINIGVDIFNEDANVAQTENSKLMNKVIDDIKNIGINDNDIKTISYNVYKNTKYNPIISGKKEEKIEGYTVRNIIEVTVRDIEKVGKVIDKASKAGANSIGSIRFGVVDEEKYYNEALKLAMKSAKDKADSILGTFGASANKPYSIIESGANAPVYYYKDRVNYGMESETLSTPIETNELEITARVLVKYKY